MSIKILQISSEVTPIVKSGGLADVVSALPQALHKLGHDCRIVIPKYSFLNTKDLDVETVDKFEFKSKLGQNISSTVYKTKIPGSETILYLISTSIGFESPSLYPTESEGEQYRFIVFGLAIQVWLKRLDWKPDIVHGHDWMAGAYLHLNSMQPKPLPSLLTIHNAKYQGELNTSLLGKFKTELRISGDSINLLKLSLLASTTINTVSDAYAKEIHTSEYGYGIEELIKSRTSDVYGIINGLDLKRYTTEDNVFINPSYSVRDVHQKKLLHKKKLLQEVGLKNAEKPLFAVVGRTGSQKGMDILAKSLATSELLNEMNFVILVGRGTKWIEALLEETALKFSDSLHLSLGFDDDFSHQIYAAADFIVMPSKYEPCGLSQMIGMRYGSIPVVRKTGGLADTVRDYKESGGGGVVYLNHSVSDLTRALSRALDLFADKALMRKLIVRNMTRDFSWSKPAEQYALLYRKAIESAN